MRITRALNADPALRHDSIRRFWGVVEPLLDEAASRMRALKESGPFRPIPPVAPPVAAPMPTWQVLGPALGDDRLHAGVIDANGRSVVAVGAHGLYEFSRGAWSRVNLTPPVNVGTIRGMVRLLDGKVLLFGDGGFAMTLLRSGAAEHIPLRDPALTWLGAAADEHGLLLVGRHSSRDAGVLVELARGGSPHLIVAEGTSRLHGVVRLSSGVIMAVGAHGALLEVRSGEARQVPWARTGHLYAVAAAADDAALVVGSGGHALFVTPAQDVPGVGSPPRATLESVQTTRDLRTVTVDDTGTARALGDNGRLLERRNIIWTRIPVDACASGRLLAVHSQESRLTVLEETGLVLEGLATQEAAERPLSPNGPVGF